MSDANTHDEDAEFEAGFSSILTDQARTDPSDRPAANAEQDPPAEAQGAEDKQADNGSEPAEDPFASLHPEVRARLEAVNRLAMELETARRQLGQIPALQSRIDKLAASVPREPAPPQRLEKVEKLRGELPEIADALDEIVSTLNTAREAAPAPQQETLQRVEPADTADMDEVMTTLDEARADWRQTLLSTEFQRWLAGQPESRRTEVTTTKKPAVILRALKDYDTAKPAPTNPQATAARTTRMASAAQATSGAARRGGRTVTDDDAEFEAGFRSVRGT